MKRCYKCKEEKPLDQFYRNRSAKDGHQSRCKDCHRTWAHGYVYQYEQERRKRDPEYNERWLAYKRRKDKEWREKNPEKVHKYTQRTSKRRANDPVLRAKYTEYEREHRQARQQVDPDFHEHLMTLAREGQSRRRARLAGGGGAHTEAQWKQVCKQFDHRCLRCGEQRPLTEDHVIPITKGGSDNIENIQPLCGPCNSWKGTKIIDFR